MSDLKYDIIRNIGLLGHGSKGWKKEVNIISWNERKPKLDIRDWDESHDKMGRGITLHSQEVENLKGILNNLDLEELKQGTQETQEIQENQEPQEAQDIQDAQEAQEAQEAIV